MSRTAFVTVGTTKFDALIAAVDTAAVAEALSSHGYDRLVMQVCAGACWVQSLGLFDFRGLTSEDCNSALAQGQAASRVSSQDDALCTVAQASFGTVTAAY